ncbi:MAG: hypothetical protein JRC68_10115 [Deltaproteobacteria bacterium]|nr:hypothetical protein [Deltaproteobacteria bacterium]
MTEEKAAEAQKIPEGTFDLQELMAQIGLKDFMLTKCRADLANSQRALLDLNKKYADLQVHCADIEGKLKEGAPKKEEVKK